MKKFIYGLLAFTMLGLGIGACAKDGPAENAGEKIDNAVEKAGDKVEDATDGHNH